MTHRRIIFATVSSILAASLIVDARAAQENSPVFVNGGTVDSDAAVHIPAITIPFSSYASPQAKSSFLAYQKFITTYTGMLNRPMSEQRRMEAERLTPALQRAQALYAVDTKPTVIGGVRTDVVTPKEGVSDRNKSRVLISLHGGGFESGTPVLRALESIPAASVGRIKVVAVDYRQGPESKFPAATQDVTAVYRELLKTYKPRNIGIYGCSAGGMLTAEAIAWFEKEKLPLPGAIGIFCASAGGWHGGDSGALSGALTGAPPPYHPAEPPHPSVSNKAYFSDVDIDDPLVSPINSNAVLSKFPPTLIVTSSRDGAFSPAIYTHKQLVKLGVDADLHVWDGLIHAFFATQPELPESREVWDVVTKFFDKHLDQ